MFSVTNAPRGSVGGGGICTPWAEECAAHVSGEGGGIFGATSSASASSTTSRHVSNALRGAEVGVASVRLGQRSVLHMSLVKVEVYLLLHHLLQHLQILILVHLVHQQQSLELIQLVHQMFYLQVVMYQMQYAVLKWGGWHLYTLGRGVCCTCLW